MGEGVSFERLIEYHKRKSSGNGSLGNMSFGEFVKTFEIKTELFTQ